MDYVKKLISLSNSLDFKGFTEEASDLDQIVAEIISTSQDWPSSPETQVIPGQSSKHEFEADQVEPISGQKVNPKMHRFVNTLKELRRELGLDPNTTGPLFDKQVAKVLQQKYPGAWNPLNRKQPAAEILRAIKQQKQMDFSETQPEDIWGNQGPYDL